MTDPDLVTTLRERAHLLYDGKAVRHRSCGVAIAETFGVAPGPYTGLRKGGLTGEGRCGAMLAGELVLAELLADPDPTGPVTPALREATAFYRAELDRRLGVAARAASCNELTSRFPIFQSEERHGFCTDLVTEVAEVLALAATRFGATVVPAPPPAR